MKVSFYGVRGSCPCPCPANQRYGGNTASIALAVEGEDPILLDLGTGLRLLADDCPTDGTFRGTALVTHIHWDHVQGLPFFPPVHVPGAVLDIYGPEQAEGPLEDVFNGFMRPPYFPVQFSQLQGDIRFIGVKNEIFSIGHAKVIVRPVPHVGATVGYRIEWDGRTVAYISDHQAPLDLETVAPEVLELCEDADLVIHDAQYTRAEFAQKSDWGHCTTDYAVRVAAMARARHLVLFHHDPAHDDDQLDGILAETRCLAQAVGVPKVTAAYEGLRIEL
ncbi:MAG: hypothetical protein QOG03_787 [Actinomycetota bacterium]|nr:hypothetical protein [Actinomycetota bacterium]